MNNKELKSFRRKYDRSDPDIQSLCSRIDDGLIDLNPDFQRNYVWTEEKASLLIESIILNIPIPNVYIAEKEEDNVFEVIDGSQRLTSIYKFINNEFKLQKLEKLPELNGKTYKELSTDDQNWIKRFSLSVVSFDNQCDPDMKFEIFLRYNQGSVALKPQELRNCLFRGYFNDQIKALSNNDLIKDFFNESNNEEENKDKKKDKKKDRFEVEELILRGIARINYEKMVANTDLSVSKTNQLQKFLNDFMHTFKNNKEEVDIMIQEYLNLLQTIKDVLGVEMFHKSDTSTYKKRYDIILLAFNKQDKQELLNNKEGIKGSIYEKIGEIDEMTKGNVATQSAVENRLEVIQEAIEEGIHNYINYI